MDELATAPRIIISTWRIFDIMASLQIFHYSGTGNSLHVARELQQSLPGTELTAMVSLLDKQCIQPTSDIVGLVFPVYFGTVPIPVHRFLEKTALETIRYLFVVVTWEGAFSIAYTTLQKLLQKKGKELDAFFFLKMAGNSPTGLKPTPGDKSWPERITHRKIADLESIVQDRLVAVRDTVATRTRYIQKGSRTIFSPLLNRIIFPLVVNNKKQIPFYVDSTCTECGTCANVCPSGKISLVEGKPLWRDDRCCFYCYACFNFCPTQSLLHRRYILKTGRYHHPAISASDIAAQKKAGGDVRHSSPSPAQSPQDDGRNAP